MAQNDPLVELGPWPKGMNNVKPAFELDKNELRDAVNVDIYDGGSVRSRRGYELVQAGAAVHSCYYHSVRDALIWATDGNLVTAPLRNLAEQTVLDTGFGDENTPIYYASVNNFLYYSDGYKQGIVTPGGEFRYWGVPIPEGYTVSATTGGGFYAGTYLVTAVFVTDDGEHSGALPPVSVTLADGGLISITGIPVPDQPNVAYFRIYVSDLNSEDLFAMKEVAAGVTSTTVGNSAERGELLSPVCMYLRRFPPAKHLEYTDGRIFGALGSAVIYTEPLWYGVYRPAENFYLHPVDIDLIAAVTDGLYVASDDTAFYKSPGHPDVEVTQVLAYGAASGTRVTAIDGVSGTAAWWTDRGLVIAGPGGQVKNLTIDALAVPKHTTGSAMFRHQDGIKQIVTTVGGGGDRSQLVASDWADAELIRGGRHNEG